MQDHTPCVFFSDDGDRVGTYKGHNGVVWTYDITRAPLASTPSRTSMRAGPGLTPAPLPQPIRGVS